jgi:hypothetical protein
LGGPARKVAGPSGRARAVHDLRDEAVQVVADRHVRRPSGQVLWRRTISSA